MAGAKIVVLYPAPRDGAAFERAYTQRSRADGDASEFQRTDEVCRVKDRGHPDGSPPPFHRVAELHFPSLAALQAAAGSPSAQRAVAHAFSISSGGAPVLLVAEEKAKPF